MDTRETFDAIFTRLGWTYDRGDELFKDRDGQLIDPENILAMLPENSTWDDLADYEWWVTHGKPQTP